VPKIVDHNVQRQKFAEATMRLVARQGLEGVRMRAVAAEANLSYGSLFHYFESKDDLLKHAVQHSMAQQTQRVNDYQSRYKGMKALEHLLCDDAITNESSRDAWLVWQTFLYKAALQESFAELHTDLINGWLARIAGLLADAKRAGEVDPELDVKLEAMALWTYSAGIGQMGLLDRKLLPPNMQRKLIVAYLKKLVAK